MAEAVPRGRVFHERHDRILKIIIDNVAKKNSFTPDMMEQLSDALTLLDGDDGLWVGVICANGPDFTAGLNMPMFFGPNATRKPLREGSVDPFGMAKACRKPIVTAVQGICFTLGIELMLAGDIVIAAADCRFSQLEPKRGIAAMGGAHYRFIARAGWGDAMYHLLLADEFSAAEAHRIGFVQEVVAPGKQIERAMDVARIIAGNAPRAVQVTKAAGRAFIEAGEQAAIAFLPRIRERVLGTADAAEGIKSFLERRKGNFTGE
jgi:enoyl-CoA hydratase/carnithine racemase